MRHPLSLLTHEVPAIRLATGSTALVLQDLHRPFADPAEGTLAHKARDLLVEDEFAEFFEAVPEVVRNSARVLEEFRRLGLRIDHLRWAASDQEAGALQSAMGWKWAADSEEAGFVPELAPLTGEYLHEKVGWGALSSPSLVPGLHGANIESVVLVGVPFDFGIRQSCLELADQGFGVLLVTDATAPLTLAAAAPTRGNLTHGMTKQRSTAELLGLLAELKREGSVWV